MDDREKIGAIFEALNAAPEPRRSGGSGGEILLAAVIICLTLLFWPELRHLIMSAERWLR